MLLFIRHSERLDAVIGKKEWYKTHDGKKNILNPPLSKPNGENIAHEKIKILLKDIDCPKCIYSSPAYRCVETAIVFQKFIYDKFGAVSPICIEYGLVYTSSGTDENWFTSPDQNRIKFIDDNFIIDDPLIIGVDNNMLVENLVKKYNDATFDTTYVSFLTQQDTQNECTFGKSIENRILVAKHLAKQIVNNEIALVVTHGEMMTILECYGTKLWNYIGNRSLFGGDDNYCSCVKFNIVKSNLVYQEHITYGNAVV